jgi:cytochrome c-type biogenesis protein
LCAYWYEDVTASATLSYSVGWVFLAGVASFLSPCTVPLLPGYIAYIAARSTGVSPSKVEKWRVLVHGVFFVLGFTALFVLLGATASAIGRGLLLYRDWITRIGGIVMIGLGLYLTGLIRPALLERELRAHFQPDPRLGYMSSFLLGIVFSAGWTPCIGPILTSVLMLAAYDASLPHGMLMLAVYSLGLGIPFLVLALLFDRLGIWVGRLSRVSRIISIVAGLALAAVGILLLTGQMAVLSRWMPAWESGL